MSLDKLKEQLKTQNFDRLYVLCGNEEYLRKYYRQAIIKKCVQEDFADFNLNILDGKNGFSFDTFEAAVNGLPMMAEKKVVLVKNLVPPVMNAAMIANMTPVLTDLPESTVCIFDYDSTNLVDREKKFNPMMKLMKQANATVVTVDEPKEADLARWVARHFAARKKRIDSKEVYYLLSVCDHAMESLTNEIEKICTYTVTDEVSRKQIDAVVTKSVEATVFQLSDALVDRDYDSAFHRLDELFYLRTEPTLIVGALASGFETIYGVKTLTEAGMSREQLIPLAGIYRPSLYQMYSRMAAKVSLPLVNFVLRQLSKVDVELKSSRMDARTVLELFLGSVLAYDEKTGRRPS